MTPQADQLQTGPLQSGNHQSGIHQSGSPLPVAATATLLTIDVLDPDTGMAEVEDDQGRNFELPAAWLPGAAEGLAYRALPHAGGVSFTPLVGGARELRERSKQTLLEFSDEHEGADENGSTPHEVGGADEHGSGTLNRVPEDE